MITTTWINREQIQQYKQISNSIHNDKLNQIIIETQLQDIMPLVGERLFMAISQDIINSGGVYDDLLNGVAYEYNNITYQCVGLRAILASYIYGRHAMFGDVIDNAFSMTRKLNVNESQPIDYNTKKSLYQLNRNEAFNLWKNVERYLIRTENELFKECYQRASKTFKISKIG